MSVIRNFARTSLKMSFTARILCYDMQMLNRPASECEVLIAVGTCTRPVSGTHPPIGFGTSMGANLCRPIDLIMYTPANCKFRLSSV